MNDLTYAEKCAIQRLKLMKWKLEQTPKNTTPETYFDERAAIQTILNLIYKNQTILNNLEKKLTKHIKFCEEEAASNWNNDICHISLSFEKNLLKEITGEEIEN